MIFRRQSSYNNQRNLNRSIVYIKGRPVTLIQRVMDSSDMRIRSGSRQSLYTPRSMLMPSAIMLAAIIAAKIHAFGAIF